MEIYYASIQSFLNFWCAIESRDELPDPETLKVKIMEDYDSGRQKRIELKEIESGAIK